MSVSPVVHPPVGTPALVMTLEPLVPFVPLVPLVPLVPSTLSSVSDHEELSQE
jgi:hypothetical protein